ncbi:transcriptional Coactivator p15-domain-containing protein [Mycena galopus ATCC 62051]|nr:transcriptional Coactivator p15-domain-containing protein [Mycena galopus ATCC 62051]
MAPFPVGGKKHVFELVSDSHAINLTRRVLHSTTSMKRKSNDEEESVKPRSKPSKKTKVKAEENDELESDEPDAPLPTVKKPTKYSKDTTKTKAEDSDAECTVEVSSDGEKFINLGKNKRATVRSFKGTTLLDIREFYVDKESGESKPGKKGISLTVEQWQELKQATKTLDQLIAEVKK